MSALSTFSVDELLREFGPALVNQAGATYGNVDIGHDYAAQGGWRADFELTYRLGAVHRVDVDSLALAHALDPAAFVTALVKQELRPFSARVHRAVDAAGIAWAEGLEAPLLELAIVAAARGRNGG